MIQDVTSETRSRVDLASVWRPSASPPVLYTAVGVYIKFYICRLPLLHQPLPSTRGLQRVYSSTAVYSGLQGLQVYRYTAVYSLQRYTLPLRQNSFFCQKNTIPVESDGGTR